MHAAHENNIGPSKVCAAGALNILINETDPPALRQIGSDDQQALGRHESAYTGHKCKCVSEGAEGRRIGRKYAKDVTAFLDWNGAAQANLLTLPSVQFAPMAARWPGVRLFPGS